MSLGRGFRVCAMIAVGLSATCAVQALQLTVTWDITSSDQLGFNIERSSDGTNFAQVATVAATVTSYSDLNLASGSYWYRVRAFNTTTYSAYSNVATTQTAVSAPSFTAQPLSQSVATGANITFSAVATGAPVPTLQWFKNGVAIPGATISSLALSNVSATDAASYTVSASNSAGTVTSIAAVLSVTAAPPVISNPPPVVSTSRLANFSARAIPANGGQGMNIDYEIKGAEKSVLVRAVGPGLAAYTKAATFGDPKLSISSGGTVLATNDNWGGTSVLAKAFVQVGAFALNAASKDAAVFGNQPVGSYSAIISGKVGGVALLDIYDADSGVGRITKIDVRAPVGSGEGRLIAGFTVKGTSSLHLLIRAVGPSLGGGKTSLSDPQLELFSGTTLLQNNDNWGGSPALASTFAAAGASSLSAASKDSAMEVTLAPGTYTATVSGVNSVTGVAQLEIYEVP